MPEASMAPKAVAPMPVLIIVFMKMPPNMTPMVTAGF
jgi:hypothetical protein